MLSPKTLIVDYGVGNLLSVKRAFEYCGAEVEISSDPEKIFKAPHVVLPGVGAFANAMMALKERSLIEVIKDITKRGTPLMAICLGMQMLMDESEEFGISAGLGLIPGRVVSIPSRTTTNISHKIPHIGWNELKRSSQAVEWKNTILENSHEGDSVYFVHSFMANPVDKNHRIADCIYGGHSIAAVIGYDNIVGCQFHPEKSGNIGLNLLKRFLKF
ncbi:imidazole glycerol phosphate synthase subunit HisH [Leptospira santarosai]|uniref:imidazole glycerol phosphate synthase subunit HisH n=1 Tax=Leptospira santarosai TaxID=28183 RepID=UPI000772F36B|nr:imidazole glycerol phosphate synthase subunit HisH [Leptospira santarosai]MDI7189577.1 imidazole glycerol phosphate synthase subunit HisH [Leptospira santarosai]MDI7207029.1 imidazole glycerol phosphate synthase subunit HisH [Leptospira santarosai]MDI7211317.1 imidazole glycerol phosphate synthase subunit HisH [Leptospira santarosai]MDI7215496.1 imidazole glycerol phosphate synthase subunit HisH [Leptospira santarosai]MDI7221734.1 imidazole glycerol phosphate synthase subunit HisH [Leptospi